MLCVYKTWSQTLHRYQILTKSTDITNNLKVQGERDVVIQIKTVERNYKSPAKYKSYAMEGLLTWVRVARKILWQKCGNTHKDKRIFGEGAVKSFPGNRYYMSRKVEFAKKTLCLSLEVNSSSGVTVIKCSRKWDERQQTWRRVPLFFPFSGKKEDQQG